MLLLSLWWLNLAGLLSKLPIVIVGLVLSPREAVRLHENTQKAKRMWTQKNYG